MPVYIATFDACDCTPVPDMAFRADNMVSAVMQCQEMLEKIAKLAAGSKLELHSEPTISGIEEMGGLELMDEECINDMLQVWKMVSKV
jgi:hypothetical protein